MATKFQHKEISEAVIRAVEKVIKSQSSLEFGKEPQAHEKDIIEYNSRMRAMGPEKFNGPAYVSFVNFYRNKAEMTAKNTIGAFILYMEENNLVKILNALGRRGFTEDDQDVVADHVSEFCNACANELKAQLAQVGYPAMEMSASTTRYSDISEGIDFDWDQQKYSEVEFYFWKDKCLVASCTLGNV